MWETIHQQSKVTKIMIKDTCFFSLFLIGRRIPPNRNNFFTNRFIPKVRPTGDLDNISENAFVAPDETSDVNQDILDDPQDDLVTSTTEALPSKFQPEVAKEPEVAEEAPERPPFRRRLRRPPSSRTAFR